MPALPTKILVAVDGSENATRALEYALSLAEKLQSKVALVHVVDVSSLMLMYGNPAISHREVLDDLNQEGKRIIGKCESKAKERGLVAESYLVSGAPADKILEIVGKENCDCIVMGKRGLGRLDRLLMGSVSDKVSRLSNVPVIIVK